MTQFIDEALATQIVETVKDVCGYDVNYIDRSGRITASTDSSRTGTYHEIGEKAALTGKSIEVKEDRLFAGTQKGVNLPVYYKDSLMAVVGISGEPDQVRKFARLAEKITILLIREKELNAASRSQEEKKQYLLRALSRRRAFSDLDLSPALAEFGVSPSGRKRFLLIRLSPLALKLGQAEREQALSPLFHALSCRLFAFQYPDQYLALLEDRIFEKDPLLLTSFFQKNGSLFLGALGKSVPLEQLASSYDSCLMAQKSLSVSRNAFCSFDSLSLELLLSCADQESKTAYLEKAASNLSSEDFRLLSVYYDLDMSLSKTCGQLFLHKNTLQYKLDKIARKSSLNPRRFQDAVLLYLALKLKESE